MPLPRLFSSRRTPPWSSPRAAVSTKPMGSGRDVLLIGKIAIDQVQRIEAGERRLELGSDTLRRLHRRFRPARGWSAALPTATDLGWPRFASALPARRHRWSPTWIRAGWCDRRPTTSSDGDQSQPTPQQADLADADAGLQQRRFVRTVDRIAYDCVGHSGRGVGATSCAGAVGRHFLIGRHIAAARDDQANRIVPAFRRIILGKQFAQPPGLHANHRIGRGIEFGILAEDVDRDRIALQALGLAHLFAVQRGS